MKTKFYLLAVLLGTMSLNAAHEFVSPVYKAISGALWVLTFVVYFLASFETGAWHMTWLLFLISTAIDNIIKAIFDLRR